MARTNLGVVALELAAHMNLECQLSDQRTHYCGCESDQMTRSARLGVHTSLVVELHMNLGVGDRMSYQGQR